MRSISEFRNAVREVPEIADRANVSLVNLNRGVARANQTMAILAGVAVVALLLSTLALLRADQVARVRIVR